MKITYGIMKKEMVSRVVEFWRTIEEVTFLNGEDESHVDELVQRHPEACFVAWSETGELVGAICGGAVGSLGIIRHLAVHPDFRRQGIGKQLVEMCERSLEKSGVTLVVIFVLSKNALGQRIWTQWGYSKKDHYMALERRF